MTTSIRAFAALWLMLFMLCPVLVHAHPPGKGAWLRKESSGPSPQFTLTNQDNRKVSLDEFRGKVVLLSFIYTHCTTGCPLTTAKLASIYDALKGKDLQIVVVTIDPSHDTPDVLREYGSQFKGVDFRTWSFLTGSSEEINDVLLDYQVSSQLQAKRGPTGEVLSVSIVDHALKSYIIDRNGMKKVEYWGQEFKPKMVIDDVMKVLGERWVEGGI